MSFEYNGVVIDDLSSFIKEKASKLGYNVSSLAVAVNMRPQNLSQALSANKRMSDSTLNNVASVLKLSADEARLCKLLQVKNNGRLVLNTKNFDIKTLDTVLKMQENTITD